MQVTSRMPWLGDVGVDVYCILYHCNQRIAYTNRKVVGIVGMGKN